MGAIYGVADNNEGTVVAVGQDGVVLVSLTGGATWSIYSPDALIGIDLHGVAYQDYYLDGVRQRVWTIVGKNGTIVTTKNFMTWTLHPVAGYEATNFFGVATVEDICLVVGAGGVILDSRDNFATFTVMDSGTLEELHTISIGNSLYVIVGANNTVLVGSIVSDNLAPVVNEKLQTASYVPTTGTFTHVLDEVLEAVSGTGGRIGGQINKYVITGTVGAAEVGDTYTITLDGVDYTYTTTGAETNISDVVDGLQALINAATKFAAYVNGDGDLVVSSVNPPTDFTSATAVANGGATADESIVASVLQESATKKITVTVGGTAASGLYIITLNGEEYIYQASVPPDDNDAIAAGLADAINWGALTPITGGVTVTATAGTVVEGTDWEDARDGVSLTLTEETTVGTPGLDAELVFDAGSATALKLIGKYTAMLTTEYNFDDGLVPAEFTLSGNANWYATNLESHSPDFSLRSGAIGNSQSSAMNLDVNPAGPAEVKFWQKVSSESYFDKLRFFIDGVTMNDYSGEMPWAEITYPLTAGAHTLRWNYMKNSSGSSGQDAAWLDDVRIIEPDVTPEINFQLWDYVANAWDPTILTWNTSSWPNVSEIALAAENIDNGEVKIRVLQAADGDDSRYLELDMIAVPGDVNYEASAVGSVVTIIGKDAGVSYSVALSQPDGATLTESVVRDVYALGGMTNYEYTSEPLLAHTLDSVTSVVANILVTEYLFHLHRLLLGGSRWNHRLIEYLEAASALDAEVTIRVNEAFLIGTETETLVSKLVREWIQMSETMESRGSKHKYAFTDGMSFDDLVGVAWARVVLETLTATGTFTSEVEKGVRVVELLRLSETAHSFAQIELAVAIAITFNEIVESGFHLEISGDPLYLADTMGDMLKHNIELLEEALLTEALGNVIRFSVSLRDFAAINAVLQGGMKMQDLLTEGFLIAADFGFDGLEFSGWVMNAKNFGVSEYRNFPFNSFAAVHGVYLAAGPTGLYRLDGDKDDTTPIEAWAKTGAIDFGTSLGKIVRDAYIAFRSDGSMLLKVVTEDNRERVYQLDDGSKKIHNRRQKLERGLKAGFWEFELHNVDGADFEVEQLEFVPIILKRRVN